MSRGPLFLVVGLGVAFFPMYYLFPDAGMESRDVLWGTIVGAVGWSLLQVLFQAYVSLSGSGSGNLIASILLLVTWLYFGGVVLLLGTVVNAVAIGRPAEIVGGRDESSALNADMGRDEAAAYLRRLREDLTGSFEGLRPTTEGPIPERNPPRGTLSVTEWAREAEDGRTHEVRLRWDSNDNSTE